MTTETREQITSREETTRVEGVTLSKVIFARTRVVTYWTSPEISEALYPKSQRTLSSLCRNSCFGVQRLRDWILTLAPATAYFVPVYLNNTFFFSRDRVALCQLWKSIVLNDQDRMQHFSKQLGVDGRYIL